MADRALQLQSGEDNANKETSTGNAGSTVLAGNGALSSGTSDKNTESESSAVNLSQKNAAGKSTGEENSTEKDTSAESQITEKNTEDLELAESKENETETAKNNNVTVTGVSCRGDSFREADSGESDSYAQTLQDLLEENGSSLEVYDYTWDMAGSLSQMWLAGVSDETINTFIEDHLEEHDDPSSLSATETQLRDDREAKSRSRNDRSCIPVIEMGYYGGWNNDVQELIQQEKEILATYDQQEKYIIMGFYPHEWVDQDYYDESMEEAFGEHYLQLNDILEYNALSSEGRAQIGEAIYDKLDDLGYL